MLYTNTDDALALAHQRLASLRAEAAASRDGIRGTRRSAAAALRRAADRLDQARAAHRLEVVR